MCTELGLPDGMRERSDESNALFWGEVGEEWIGDITNPMDARNSVQIRKTRLSFAVVLA